MKQRAKRLPGKRTLRVIPARIAPLALEMVLAALDEPALGSVIQIPSMALHQHGILDRMPRRALASTTTCFSNQFYVETTLIIPYNSKRYHRAIQAMQRDHAYPVLNVFLAAVNDHCITSYSARI